MGNSALPVPYFSFARLKKIATFSYNFSPEFSRFYWKKSAQAKLSFYFTRDDDDDQPEVMSVHVFLYRFLFSLPGNSGSECFHCSLVLQRASYYFSRLGWKFYAGLGLDCSGSEKWRKKRKNRGNILKLAIQQRAISITIIIMWEPLVEGERSLLPFPFFALAGVSLLEKSSWDKIREAHLRSVTLCCPKLSSKPCIFLFGRLARRSLFFSTKFSWIWTYFTLEKIEFLLAGRIWKFCSSSPLSFARQARNNFMIIIILMSGVAVREPLPFCSWDPTGLPGVIIKEQVMRWDPMWYKAIRVMITIMVMSGVRIACIALPCHVSEPEMGKRASERVNWAMSWVEWDGLDQTELNSTTINPELN